MEVIFNSHKSFIVDEEIHLHEKLHIHKLPVRLGWGYVYLKVHGLENTRDVN